MEFCLSAILLFFFFNDTATTEIYTLPLHDALPIYHPCVHAGLHALASRTGTGSDGRRDNGRLPRDGTFDAPDRVRRRRGRRLSPPLPQEPPRHERDGVRRP